MLVPRHQRITGLTTPAHEETKEVAHVNTNTIAMTANTPSGFGMPICGGHLSETTFVGLASTSVVRDRQAVLKGDMGLAPAYVLGPQAWSPPLS